MKKQSFITFLFIVLMSLVEANAFAHDIEAPNADGITIYYNLINNTELAVSCQGSAYDSFPNEYSGDVVIPSSVEYNGNSYSVTKIGGQAFKDCSGLTSIAIPNSVTSIEYEAFSGTAWYDNQPDGLIYAGNIAYKYKGEMPNNTTIIIKEGTLGIAGQAFMFCTGLASITIPNSVTNIGVSAFWECSSLKSITIPSSVTSIGIFAFYGCSALTSFTIPDNITRINEFTFSGCSGLTSVIIPNSVTSIGIKAFQNCCSLTSIMIPEGVKTIEFDTFNNCSSLTSVIIPNSVTSIESSAFCDCSNLMSITIPDNVTSIGVSAFERCSSLASVTIGNSVTSIEDNAFEYCSSLNSVTIGNSVTKIGNNAFRGCDLTSITIPSSVTSIGEYAFTSNWLSHVTCQAETVPFADKNAFYSGFMKDAMVLYVPAASVDLYKITSPWSSFFAVMAIDNTAINNTNRQNKVSCPIWHSLDGRIIKHPSKGVYINNGRKILK